MKDYRELAWLMDGVDPRPDVVREELFDANDD